jgi:adenylate cyclase
VLPDARNPVFYRGRRQNAFELRPGEHFVIGGTTFSLTDDPVQMSLDSPAPVDERTFAPHELVQAPYLRASERIDALSRLPEIIADSPTESELLVRLVNLLLVGIPQATATAIVALKSDKIEVLHWDRRAIAAGHFRPSEKLIRQAVGGEQSVVHVWNVDAQAAAEFTLGDGVDWAFCVPIPGARTWRSRRARRTSPCSSATSAASRGSRNGWRDNWANCSTGSVVGWA